MIRDSKNLKFEGKNVRNSNGIKLVIFKKYEKHLVIRENTSFVSLKTGVSNFLHIFSCALYKV